MNKVRLKNHRLSRPCISRKVLVLLYSFALVLFISAFLWMRRNERLFKPVPLSGDVSSVCLEMFDNKSFRRGVEYELSDALAKRIEAATPYKIISSKDRADTVLSGQIVQVSELVLSVERQTGRPLEKELLLRAVVNWKDLKTGRLLIDNRTVTSQATYSAYQNQDFTYASALAANNLARRIVELMEMEW